MRAAEIYARAREADLPALWKGKLHTGNSRYTSNWTPCCGEATRKDRGSISKVNGVWRWRCFACNKGGTAIDYIAMTEGMSPEEAAKRLAGGKIEPAKVCDAPRIEERKPTAAGEAVTKVIAALKAHPIAPEVRAYLEGRGIRSHVIDEAKRRGFLTCLPAKPQDAVLWLESHVGKDLLADAGMWLKRWPAAAYRPLGFINGSAKTIELRMLGVDGDSPKAIQYGVQDHPLVWKPKGAVKRVLVVEGGVDLLSMVDMGEDDTALIIGIFGTSSWRDAWGRRIAEKYPAAHWEIATDDDEPGHVCAEAISVQLDRLGKTWERRMPFAGKDWNEALASIAA